MAADIRAVAAPSLLPSEHVVHAVTKTMSSNGAKYHRLVVFDMTTQATRKLTVAANGSVVDFEALLAGEEKAHYQAFGTIDDKLWAALAANPTGKHKVDLIYKVTGLPLRPTVFDAASEAAYRNGIEAALKPRGDAVEAEVLLKGGKVVSRAKHGPFIVAEVPGKVLVQHFKNHPDVLVVRPYDNSPAELGAAQSRLDLNLYDAFYLPGYTGTGEKVGVSHEWSTGANCTARNPYFMFDIIHESATPTACTSDAQCTGCTGFQHPGRCVWGKCTTFHGTMVAGMIGHKYGYSTPMGAPDVELYLTTSPMSHQEELGWFWSSGVSVENESWMGADTSLYDQDFYSVLGLTVVEIAGNAPAGTSGVDWVASCYAGNTICVASYNNLSSFSDFTNTKNPSTCSRWASGCDRELPHVSFHGGGATSTTNDLSIPGYLETSSGTSFAAPAATGLVALMHNKYSFPFQGWPEITRAALMAAADRDVHQIASTPQCPTVGKTYSDYHCPDERDGAGVPNALRIDSMYAGVNQLLRGWLYRSSDFDAQGKRVMVYPFLNSGQRLRVVFSWTACAGTQELGAHADLDLHILDPSGQNVFNAASYDNSYEIGEIVASQTGSYTIEIQKFGWVDCSELGGSNAYVMYGIAWDVR